MSNQVLDYMWKANLILEETLIPGPTTPAKIVQKSLMEMLSGAEDSQKSGNLTEKSENHYKIGPGVLVLIDEQNFLSPQDNTASVGSQQDFSNISRTFIYLGAMR